MADNRLRELLQDGIAAARSGNTATARRLLEEVIKLDENSEQAWLWLATVVKTRAERRICLQKVLQINPNNKAARQAMQQLGGVPSQSRARATQSAASTPPPTPANVTTRSNEQTQWARRFLILVVLVSVIGVAVIIYNAVTGNNQPTELALEATLEGSQVASTSVPTATPRPTNTQPFVVVTTRTITALPPTFTPTFTPSPTETIQPTETPQGVEQYSLLVLSRPDGQAETDLFRVRGGGSDVSQVASDVRDVSLSFDGRQMLFVREVEYEDGNMADEIFLAPFDDPDNAEQLTELRTSDASHPVFSPNSQQVAFSANVDGDQDLFLLDLSSGNISALTENDFTDQEPSWSRDGRYIVFASDQDSPGFLDIYRITFNLSGQGGGDPFTIDRLTDDNGSSYSPSFSFDSSRIVYLNDSTGDPDIVMMTSDGQSARTLTPGDTAEDRSPVWGPNGSFIVFVSNRIDNRFQVYSMDLDTQTVRRITADDQQAQMVLFGS